MKRYSIPALLLLLLLGQTLASTENRLSDIQVVLQKYIDGTATGQPALVSEAFLPSLEVQYLGEGDRLLRRTGPDYIRRIEPGKVEPRFGRIVSIDATEKSAMAKVEIEWHDRLYTDYMLLLKVEGQWRIANKVATWIKR